MAKILSESKYVEKTYYSYDFDINKDGGFTFPCDENGIIDFPSLNDGAKQNLIYCLNNTSKFKSIGKRKHGYSYKEPAVLKCNCSAEFPLINEYLGACECPECGQWYNLFGQELENPSEWET